MTHRKSLFIGMMSCLLAWLPPVAGQAMEILEEKHCVACHGGDGVSQDETVPTIAGVSPFVISDALIAFQDGARPCRKGQLQDGTEIDHCELVVGMEIDTFDEIGEHFAAMEFVPAEQEFDEALAEAGAAVHEEHCSKCHTEGGSVADDEAGILAGQWMGYLRQTMIDYRAGDRAMPGKMEPKVEALSDDDVEALVHFYASQGDG